MADILSEKSIKHSNTRNDHNHFMIRDREKILRVYKYYFLSDKQQCSTEI